MTFMLEAGVYADTAPAHWFAEYEPFDWDPLFGATIRRDAVAVEMTLRVGRTRREIAIFGSENERCNQTQLSDVIHGVKVLCED